MEKGLEAIWTRYEQGLPPDHIQVEDADPVILEPSADAGALSSQQL
jgi:hypothetical protein